MTRLAWFRCWLHREARISERPSRMQRDHTARMFAELGDWRPPILTLVSDAECAELDPFGDLS